MAILNRKIPKCDRCGAEWLPESPEARENPDLVKRCAVCKSPGWNKGPARPYRKKIADTPTIEPTLKPCRHRLLNCPVCSKENR
jgi:hypothetical protein